MCVSERIVRCMGAREIETNVMSDDTHAYTHTCTRAQPHEHLHAHQSTARERKNLLYFKNWTQIQSCEM